ncbi:Cholesterol 7-alpha-monooxygenase [Cytospora mali]|uniref:Cholesterol 7-alpha-monooxygenase n=1 Tax=Cytospora mali TaxID=578113 RepID=A0A194V3H9_CYTMA|nr:Cholesterol 7-alpha-monooxygenase [Valsa mali var. pyri (nom. inval.)]
MGFWEAMSRSTALEILWMPALASLSLDKGAITLPVLGALLCVQAFINYVLAAYRWHLINRFEKSDKEGGRLPPLYPSTIPYLGNALSFAWNNASFLRAATCYDSRLTSSRISFLGFEIYAFQERQTIAKIWKQPTLSSPISMFIYVLKYFFGLPERVVSVYRTDNSGPFPKPYMGSNVPAEARIDHITHHGFLRGLGGPGLLPTTRRYMTVLVARMEGKSLSREWTEMADFSKFFQDVVGSSLVECLYGPALLRLNPEFIQDLWGFDNSVPWLARGVPSWIKPSAYKHRQNCVDQLKRWYAYARAHFDDSSIGPDGDGDPYWGSNLMRYRQEKLLAVKNHDDDALARMDLGLAWGAVGNTIPCAMLSAFHIFKDPILLHRVRGNVEGSYGYKHLLDIDPNKFIKEPLLSSIYAETLRLYVKTYFMVSSPHADVHLGRWSLPKGRIGIMNAGISHMDEAFWNQYGGEHPVSSFWADRFVIDPTDPQSGPVAPHVRESPDWVEPRREGDEKPRTEEPFFSMDGTEGSWFPYGGEKPFQHTLDYSEIGLTILPGGHSICPGRFLAKSVIMFTCALLATDYDIEILSDKVEMSTWRFGLGVEGLKHALPFRIRKRTA